MSDRLGGVRRTSPGDGDPGRSPSGRAAVRDSDDRPIHSPGRPTYRGVTMLRQTSTIEAMRSLKERGTSPLDNSELQARMEGELRSSEPALAQLHNLARERVEPAPRRGLLRRKRTPGA